MRTTYKNPGQRQESKDDTAGGGKGEPKGGMGSFQPIWKSSWNAHMTKSCGTKFSKWAIWKFPFKKCICHINSDSTNRITIHIQKRLMFIFTLYIQKNMQSFYTAKE